MGNVFENVCVVVPARLASTRLPEKPLKDLCGKPMIVRVCENLEPLKKLGASIVVATDSDKIISECNKFCINSKMTGSYHTCGTSRCFEASLGSNCELVLNIQGDEPFLDVEPIVKLVEEFKSSRCSGFDIGTVAIRSTSIKDYGDPNKVKVTCYKNRRSLYFSRDTIPY